MSVRWSPVFESRITSESFSNITKPQLFNWTELQEHLLCSDFKEVLFQKSKLVPCGLCNKKKKPIQLFSWWKVNGFWWSKLKTVSRREVCWQNIFVILFKPCICNEWDEFFFVAYTGDMVTLAWRVSFDLNHERKKEGLLQGNWYHLCRSQLVI